MQAAQQQNHKSHSKPADTAPYATQLPTKPEILETVEEDVPSLRYKLGAGLDPHKVDKYKSRLEEKRKQVGLITDPTTELQQAEKCLAEVRKTLHVVSQSISLHVCTRTGHGHAGRAGSQES